MYEGGIGRSQLTILGKLLLEDDMDINHLEAFITTALNATTLATIAQNEAFDLRVSPGRRFEIVVTPHSTGNDRPIKEHQIEDYISQYKYLDRSLKTSDYYGHNNSYWVCIAWLYQQHLSICNCYQKRDEHA